MSLALPSPQRLSYLMSDPTKYALWLVPQGQPHGQLYGLISRLAKGHSAPAFEPHLTLLGAISSDDEDDVLRRTHILASRLEPFEIKLTEVMYKDDFYQCLYLKAEPTDALVRANLEAKLIMAEICGPSEFYPHLSLLYGHFFPMVKEAIIEDIGGKIDITFTPAVIKLIRVSGGPKDWKAVGEIRLQ